MEHKDQYRSEIQELARWAVHSISVDSTLASLHDLVLIEIAHRTKQWQLPQHVREHLEYFNKRFGN